MSIDWPDGFRVFRKANPSNEQMLRHLEERVVFMEGRIERLDRELKAEIKKVYDTLRELLQLLT